MVESVCCYFSICSYLNFDDVFFYLRLAECAVIDANCVVLIVLLAVDVVRSKYWSKLKRFREGDNIGAIEK